MHPTIGISVELFNDQIINIASLLIVIVLSKQYGALSFSEFLPRGKDYVVLSIGLILKFWAFGLIVGTEGLKADPALMALTEFQYGLKLAALIFTGPLLEEIILRRYFYEMLDTLYSRETAVIITVSVSALLHWHPDLSWLQFFWHLSSALVFTIAYLMSRLGVSVLLHGFNNFLAVLLSR
ncbi:MAG: lysostaphin resistance A-like protein [Nitrospirales bacterium]